jgi:acetaldehyde dehydrogenase (acetylating)
MAQPIPPIDKQVVILNTYSDRPNANGIVYTKEAIEKMMAELKKKVEDKKMLVFASQSDNTIKDVVAVVKDVNINDDKIIATLGFVNNGLGHTASDILEFKDKFAVSMDIIDNKNNGDAIPSKFFVTSINPAEPKL